MLYEVITEWGALAILGGCIVLFGFMPALVLDFINRVTPGYLSTLTQLLELRSYNFV